MRPTPGVRPQTTRYWLGCHGPTFLDWNCYPQTLQAPISEAESWWPLCSGKDGSVCHALPAQERKCSGRWGDEKVKGSCTGRLSAGASQLGVKRKKSIFLLEWTEERAACSRHGSLCFNQLFRDTGNWACVSM